MTNEEMSLRCSSCRQEIGSQDQVTLDILHTVTHTNCEPTKLPLRDTGSFQELQNNYSFLNTL